MRRICGALARVVQRPLRRNRVHAIRAHAALPATPSSSMPSYDQPETHSTTARTRRWCRRWDSNPQGRKDRGILSALRMPVPPLRRAGDRTYHGAGSVPPRACEKPSRRDRAVKHSLQSGSPAIACATRRGCSSVGRALEWHSRGRRFDPAQLHHGIRRTIRANSHASQFFFRVECHALRDATTSLLSWWYVPGAIGRSPREPRRLERRTLTRPQRATGCARIASRNASRRSARALPAPPDP